MSDTPAPAKNYAREIMKQEQFAAATLSGMVMGNIQKGQLPPTEIFQWFGRFVAYHLSQIELDSLDDRALGEELESTLLGYVQALDLVFSIAKNNKMLVYEDELRNILKARKLHLPTHFDSTYGGALP